MLNTHTILRANLDENNKKKPTTFPKVQRKIRISISEYRRKAKKKNKIQAKESIFEKFKEKKNHAHKQRLLLLYA